MLPRPIDRDSPTVEPAPGSTVPRERRIQAPRPAAAAPRARESRPAPAPRLLDGLRVIALFKFLKALALIATGYGAHLLLNQALLDRLDLWIASLTDSYVQRLLQRAIDWVDGLSATRIHIVVAVTLGYTAVVLAEGVGLWMRKLWAEWFTVTATAALIPFELWELAHRPPDRRLAVLVMVLINAAVVAYLAWWLRRTSARHQAKLSGAAGGAGSAG